MLLNIDKTYRTAMLHSDDCGHIPRPHGSRYKPVGEIGRDGGWFPVGSVREAQALAFGQMPSSDFIRCQSCLSRTM